MKKYQNILCPIDFSDFTYHIIETAIKMAEPKSTIYCHSVLVVPYNLDSYGMTINYNLEQELEDVYKLKTKELKDLYDKKHTEIKLIFSYETKMDISDSILEKLKAVKAQLIVMGTHGRTGIDRMFMGSVAESVLREANCDALLLKIKKDKE